MRAARLFSFVPLLLAVSCADPGVGPADPTEAPLDQFAPQPSFAVAGNPSGLQHLETFPTPPDLSPDDIAFRSSDGGPRLVVVSVNPESFLYEMTLEGELLAAYAGLGSFSLTRGTSGVSVDHFFQVSGGGQSLTITEFDRDYTFLRHCLVPLPETGTDWGSFDAMAYHHINGTLVVADLDDALLLEVDCSSGNTGSLVRTVVLDGFPAPTGMVFDQTTRTYFGVLHGPSVLVQFDEEGTLLQSIDLQPFGVQQPVGITTGQGKIFVADELKGELNDTAGFIYVFRLKGLRK